MPFIEMDPDGVWARSPRWAKVAIALVVVALVYLVGVIIMSLSAA